MDEKIIKAFQEYEKLRGKSKGWYEGIKYVFVSFKEYLSINNIDYLCLNIKEVQEYQSYLSEAKVETGESRYSVSSINGMISLLKAFYNFLLKKDYIHSNPFKYIKRLRGEKKVIRDLYKEKEMSDFLDMLFEFEDEDTLIFEMYRYKAHVIAEVLYSTGARIGEIALLKESDIDFEKGIVKITDVKTKQERMGILNEYAKEVLRIYINEMRELYLTRNSEHTEYVFNASMGYLCAWFNEKIKKYSGDKDFRSHNFRHCVGYHLLRSGCRIRYIQAILGHRELRSTSIYTKIDKEDLRGVLDEYHPRQFRQKSEGT